MTAAGSPGDRQAPDGANGPPEPGEEVARPDVSGDAAVSAPGKHGERRTGRRRVRGVLAAVLVVLFAILLPVTITATWAHRTVVNTDAYVATVTPIAASPEVQAAVSREVTNEIYAALNPQQIIASALPPKAAALAGPLAHGARGYLQDGINKILASPKFQQLWVSANRFAHAQLITVLNGDSKALQTTDGQVVLNLVPLLNEALKNVQTRGVRAARQERHPAGHQRQHHPGRGLPEDRHRDRAAAPADLRADPAVQSIGADPSPARIPRLQPPGAIAADHHPAGVHRRAVGLTPPPPHPAAADDRRHAHPDRGPAGHVLAGI